MTALSQFTLKNITNKNIYAGIGFSGFAMQRSLSLFVGLLKYKGPLRTRFQFPDNKVRQFNSYETPISRTINPISSENNLDKMYSDDEDQISMDSHKHSDKYNFRDECSKQEQLLSTQLKLKSSKTEEITNEEWDSLRSSVVKMFGTLNERNIDAVMINNCAELKSLSLGKSYFKYLKSTNKPINRAVYGNFLRLFYICREDCSSDDLNEIVTLYKELLEVYPVLDSHTAEKAIFAISLTKVWKDYEKLFITIRQFYHPSTYVYKIVILTAFDNEEFELGWKLMEEMQYEGLNVPEEVFSYWFEKVKHRKLEEDFLRVLNFLNHFKIKPSDEFINGIKKTFEEYNVKGKGTFTRITRNGECRSCHSNLEPCYVSEEEFNELKKEFLNPILVGRDIFQKTKPEEFKEFLKFLKESAPFDVVLDGLNIAFASKHKSISANTQRLKSVVQHCVTYNKKTLVLGRKHMASWRTANMDFVFRNAHVFLTDNLSQDDPFMLYAALYSGLGTIFVSKDMMRGHKFLLADPKLRNTFHKWQSKHQYFITNIGYDGRVYFKEPVSFMQTIQQDSRGGWHIPYVVRGEEISPKEKVDHLHRHWLCLQKNPARVEVMQEQIHRWNDLNHRPNDHNLRQNYHNHRPNDHNLRPNDHNQRPNDHNHRPNDHNHRRNDHNLRPSFRPEKERQHWRNERPSKKQTVKIDVKSLLKDDL